MIRASTKSALALSWKIATEPTLYKKLAPNPYSSHALQIILERFPDADTADIAHAIILAEPEGKYDRIFKQLSQELQETELQKQKNISTELHVRLIQYCNKYAKEFNQLPRELVYKSLSVLIFETDDLDEIEQKYTQNQRRDFRLSIVNFIEDNSSTNKKSEEKATFIWPLLRMSFAILSLISLFYFVPSKTNTVTQHVQAQKQILGTETQKEIQEPPTRLKIPNINVDATVEYMGLTPEGAMDVPSNTVNVGWYKLGPSPGKRGSAVISGHFDGRIGESGVFNNLYKLKQGDKIYVIDDLGTTTTFIVRESRIFNPGYADEVFLSNDGGTHLNLITCDGVWDGAKKSYNKRLVVFTDIEY